MNYTELDLIIIKHILSNKKNALEFMHSSNEKIFAADVWRFVKVIIDYIKLYKEVPTRKVINERIGAQKNESLLKYVNKIWDAVDAINVDEKEYKHDLEKIKKRFTERLIYDLKDKLVDEHGSVDLTKSISELNSTVNHIKGINQVKAYEQKSVKECLADIRERYMQKQKNPSYGDGIKTGIKFFDELTSGLLPSEALLILGPTGGGKSILLSQIAKEIWLGDNNIDIEKDFKPGNDVVYFSLEMPLQHCLERLCANLASVRQIGIRDATLDDEEKKKLGKALKFIERYPNEFIIVDVPRGSTPESIELIYNNIVEEKGKKPKAVIIDYLALMSYSNDNISDWEVQMHLSEAVAEFGRVNNINLITAAQMTDDDKNKPGSGSTGTHRISRSRAIGHNFNFIAAINKRPNEQQRPDFILDLIKSRRTALGTGTLYKNLECCAILNQPLNSGSDSFDISNNDNNDINDISDIVE